MNGRTRSAAAAWWRVLAVLAVVGVFGIQDVQAQPGRFQKDPVTSKSAGPADPALIEDLVIANRMIVDKDVIRIRGHLSVRHNLDPNRFLMSRSMAPGLVTADDIMEFDIDGNAIDHRGREIFSERYIHSEIYRARPDVSASRRACAARAIPGRSFRSGRRRWRRHCRGKRA